MNIKNLNPNRGKVEITLTVEQLSEPKEVNNKKGNKSRVCNAMGRDENGDSIKVSLWGDEIDKVEEGNTIKIINGYCS